MKRFILSICVLMTMLGIANAQRFALIDSEFILKQIPAYEQANKQMESFSKQWQTEIENQSKAAKSLYEDYQKNASKWTDAVKAQKEEAIVQKEKQTAELRNKYFGPDGEMQKKRRELIDPFQDKIYEAVKTLATRNGYDVVFDRANAQSMLFASPRIDISNEVLKLLGYSK